MFSGVRLRQAPGPMPRLLRFRSAFSLVEMLIVIAVIIILIALLLPAIGMAKSRARQSQCASNLAQLHKAWTIASAKLPQAVSAPQWPAQLTPYVEQETRVYICPDDTPPTTSASYGMNSRAFRMADQDNGRITMLDFKTAETKVVGQTLEQLNTDWPAGQATRHFQNLNVALYDGHVELKSPEAIDPRYCEIYVRYWRPARDGKIDLLGCLLPGQTAGVSVSSVVTTSASGTTATNPTTGTGGSSTDGSTSSGIGTAAGSTTISSSGSASAGSTSASTTTAGSSTSGSTSTTTTTGGTSTGGSTTGNTGCAGCGAFVGLNGVSLNGVAYTDSYNSDIGPYSAATAGSLGNVCSNGPISLVGGSHIYGDAHPGQGYTVSGGSSVSGSTTPLGGIVVVPPINFQNYAISNSNSTIGLTSKGNNPVSGSGAFSLSGNESLTLSTGTYYFTSFSMSGNSTLNINGSVVIYCTGNFTQTGGSISNLGHKPRDFQIYCSGSSVELKGSSVFYGFVYAPNAAITRNGGSAECYGALLGNTLSLGGSVGVHFDQSLQSLISIGCQ